VGRRRQTVSIERSDRDRSPNSAADRRSRKRKICVIPWAQTAVSLLVDSWCPRQFTLCDCEPAKYLSFQGFLTAEGMAWRLYCQSPTSQRVRVALFNVLAPSNAARGISPAPLWHPPKSNRHLSSIKAGPDTCARWYTCEASDAVSSGSPDIHRWLSGV